MSERRIEIMPFTMRFQESVKDQVVPISGRYNKHLQVWEDSPDKSLSKSFPVASFPQQEKPPTVSTVITAPPGRGLLPKTDMGPDD